MSADNQIAVIQFLPDLYGVCHLVGFNEDINSNEVKESLLVACYRTQNLYNEFDKALDRAKTLEDEIEYVEYGIVCY